MKEAGGWHALIPSPITGPEDALAFVNECGFCTWGPVARLSFPNLALRHGGDGNLGPRPHLVVER
jgi:hypothetical protein